MTKQTINIRRVYDDPARGAGTRFLVDRIWPRGFKKQDLHLHGWLKAVAPTTDLRHWFGHDVVRWTEFRTATKLSWMRILRPGSRFWTRHKRVR